MFKTRILMAFVALALVAVAQGVIGYFAMVTASQNVQKGRVANELLVGYVELLSNKQRLRVQLTNDMTGLESDPQQSQVFYYNMVRSLDTLDRLARTAKALSKGDQELVPEHLERSDSLLVLRKGVDQLGEVLAASDWRFAPTTPEAKRVQLKQVFDVSDGQDLRVALTQSIARERLVTARDRAAADVSLDFMTNLVITAAVTLTLFLVLLAFYFVKSLSKPVDRLIRGAQALQGGDLTYRIPANGHDEFSLLASSMNEMASEIARLRASDQQVREQLEVQVNERTTDLQEALHRLEKIELRRRQMFADISHELKTPTTAIRGEAEISLRHSAHNSVEYKETLSRIVQYTQQLSYIVDDMLTLARSDIDALMLDRKAVDVSKLCMECVSFFRPQISQKGCVIETRILCEGQVLGDAQRLKQVFNIVLDNAIQYSGQAALIRISTTSIEDGENMRRCVVTIEDNGAGISAHDVNRVFERHYRGSTAKKIRPDGSGLGLPLAAAIVRAHHGTIELSSEENKGCRVTINLPAFESMIEE